jgi:hypothetical protein
MTIYDILAFAMFAILFVRIYLSYKMDRLRGSNSITFKFLFGAYAFDAVTPVIRKPKQAYEARLKRVSNIRFIAFWTLFIGLMLTIWINYR